MTKFIAILVAGIVLLLGGACAEAQIVRIGPGGSVRIRAPFVRVNVGPNGETYVRAPFVRVYSPGYAQYSYYYEVNSSDQAVAPEEMPLAELERLLIDRWETLHQDLGIYPTGKSWQEYLSLPASLRTDPDSLPPATAQSPEKLLERYDLVAETAEYSVVAGLASFQEMRHLLTVFIDRQPDESPFEELPLPLPTIPDP